MHTLLVKPVSIHAMKKKIVSALTLILSLSLLGITGCSTVEGLGKDIQKGGEAIEKTAKKY